MAIAARLDADPGDSESGIRTAEPVSPGDVTLMGLTAIPAEEIAEDAPAARRPEHRR